ncbi:DUF4886 domain-containing protein [Winogradskyella psychrotolerans]|uniref:DUF4886 domain-containing protein n=1 Tax=Winogradskyella psychrotolerans TaxID=1344585 RepID=UPI001C07CEBD|nr:DUF4886 domain-containing protein [Winogradskyella psychrotolerans]MBU2927656.1 DUF4886 domain-containing protein [Winogradskyella psychrotolerans]
MKNRTTNKFMKLLQISFCMLLLINLNSCTKEDDITPLGSEDTLNVESEAILPDGITLMSGCEYSITPEFDSVIFPARSYTWSAEPAALVDFTVNPLTYAITVQTISEGTVTLSLNSDDGEVSSSVEILIDDESDGIIKILAIGNSFSEDALEAYFWGLANAEGKQVVVGNMYIGSANLDTHASNATSNSSSYSYRKIALDGTRTVTSSVSISDAVADENWDYISFQQASYESGLFDTFINPLPTLYNNIKNQNPNPCTKYILHKTWAYAQNSTHSGFASYNNDQMTMFNGIIEAYSQAENLIPTDMVIPAATAIQNGRTSFLGDGFTRDGYHLNDLGQYTASCTWYEMVFGESVIGNTYEPEGILDYYKELAQHAAHEAVLSPNEITVLTDYETAGGNGIISESVFINFSSSDNPEGWNAYSSFLEGAGIANILYPNGGFTGIAATTTARFRGINNTSGAGSTTTDLNMSDAVSQSNFYSHALDWGSNPALEESVIEFTGFESNDTYTFCFFGSRNGVSDNRDTKYTLVGATEQSANLDAANNATNTICISNVQADADGKIVLKVSAGDSNDNSTLFYYINAMKITPQ